jgi:aminocarboxymuconate-semialdehyde decarboxylase
MLKIDSHAHILPRDWPNLATKYGDDRFPVMTHTEGRHRIYKDSRFFREVWDSAFDPQTRIDDYARFGVGVQVISTVPVLFSYWAQGYQALELHRHLNDHMAGLCRDFPRHYAGIGTVPLQAPELACRSAPIATTGTWMRRSCSRSSRRLPIWALRCWCTRGT